MKTAYLSIFLENDLYSANIYKSSNQTILREKEKKQK